MSLFRAELPLLSPNAALDEGLGIEVSSGSKVVGSFQDVVFQQAQTAAPAAGSIVGFIAPYPVELVSAQVIWSVASASGTLQLTHDSGVQAPGAGTALLVSALSTASTANTVSAIPKAKAFAAVNSSLQFAVGDRLSLTFGGTLTGQAGLVVSVLFKRI